ncbi:hypothetical protein ABC733_13410 [Mangrovibacter sp. SLW1]
MNTLFAKSLSGSVITGTSLSDNSSHATPGHSVKTKVSERAQDGSTDSDKAHQHQSSMAVSLNYSVESGEVVSLNNWMAWCLCRNDWRKAQTQVTHYLLTPQPQMMLFISLDFIIQQQKA